ncbi:hypothetical protein BDV11DRAFT_175766 [Aspergillus similis]
MAEPLSIIANVIAVASLAYSSSKILFQTISGIHDAPETLVHLQTDVWNLHETIHSLYQLLEVKKSDTDLSEAQKSNLREIQPTLDACRLACDAFKAKLDGFLRRSTEGHVSLRDRLRMQFQEEEIAAFQARLSSYKSTLAIALELSGFKIASENLDATKALEAKIEDTTARLTGQMQGLQIGLQAIFDASSQGEGLIETDRQFWLTETQQSEVINVTEQQSNVLGHCYRACMAALKETTKATGHEYKYVKASKQARLLMGDLGNVKGGSLHKYSNIEVEGGWVVAGNMDGDAAKNFFRYIRSSVHYGHLDLLHISV